MIVRIRRLILEFIKPFLVFMGKLHAPFSHKKITGDDYFRALRVLRIGDIIITRNRSEISNLFIPGFYTHAAIFVGDHQIVEAVGRGVGKKDLITFLLSKDYFAIVRPNFATKEQAKEASKIAINLIGSPYDYYLHPANNAFYCAELIYHCYKVILKNEMVFVPRKVLGIETIMAQDFFDAKNKFDTIIN